MRCPGQDTRFWSPDAIFESHCPSCKATVEFFKDDTSRNCKQCGFQILNPKIDFGCASYCKFAQECLGSLPPELLAKRSDLLKDRIAFEVKRYFKDDFKRIGHIARVAGYAEQLGKQQKGDLGAIMSAAYLHEVGAVQSLADSIKPNPDYQDLNAAVAYAILTDLGAQESLKQEVCHIIEMFYQNKVSEDPNFQAFYLAHEKAEHLTTKES